MRRLGVALAAATLVLLTGCAPGVGDAVSGPDDVDVATAELVGLKAELGIEPCPRAQGSDGGLPAVTLRCFGGGRDVDLSTLQGPVILNFWQAYCGPCRKEMPALQEFHETYGDQVQIIGVDYTDFQPVGAMDLARSTGATYPQLADPQGDVVGTDAGFSGGMPYFVFLREDGSTSRVIGGIEDLPHLVDLAEEQLGIDL